MGLMSIQVEISDDLRLLSMSDSYWVRQLVEDINNFRSKKLLKYIDLTTKILNYNKDFKLVTFTRFARMVELLKQELLNLDFVNKISTITGSKSEKARDKEIQKFQNDDGCRIIILTNSGCEGYNLQQASHLINYDLPWNPAILDQRIGRIKRIGSPWDRIFVSNLVSKGSVDENILSAIERKRQWFNRIVANTSTQEKALKEFVSDIA